MVRSTQKADQDPPGDPQACFGDLVTRNEAPIRRFARGQIGHELRLRVDTDEVVQVASVRGAAEFRKDETLARMDDNAFRAWMKWLIRERVIPDLVKRHQAAKRRIDRVERLDTKAERELVERRAPRPSEELKRIEDRVKLDAALKALSPRERQIMTLHIEGKTNAEIASLLEISVKSVAVEKSRGLRKLLGKVHKDD